MKLHIGIDDTDSPRGGCTTYIGAILVQKLESLGARFVDYPNLIRLNPNVPWKTRGNGSICLRIESTQDLRQKIEEEVLLAVEQNSDLRNENTDPGIVVYQGEISSAFRDFSTRTVTGIVELEEASTLVEQSGASSFAFGSKRGLIGALAAVGEPLLGDHTYEFLAYRSPENYGKKRRVNTLSVFKMNNDSPLTFNNVDDETGRVLITPHGPDPILFGIRGETPEAVYDAAQRVIAEEPIERWVIYRTNQGTEAHLRTLKHIDELRLFNPAIIEGKVSRVPEVIPGGHVILAVTDETGDIDCAAFEPTGSFRKIVKESLIGDFVRVSGGVKCDEARSRLTLNMEKLEFLHTVEKVLQCNPSCPVCQGTMESMGRNQGYRCRKCGFRGPDMKKATFSQGRNLGKGPYLPSPRAQRHLTKPLNRYGKEKQNFEVHFTTAWHSAWKT